VGGGGAVVDKVGVGEGGVPTWSVGSAVVQVFDVGLEDCLGAGAADEAGPKVDESPAHQVGTFKGEGRARGSGRKTREEWGRRREKGDWDSGTGSHRHVGGHLCTYGTAKAVTQDARPIAVPQKS